MADEYIKREAAISACYDGYADCRDDCADNIRKVPAADKEKEMSNIDRVKDAIKASQKYGFDELSQRLTVENALTLAAIADALERIVIRWDEGVEEMRDG